VSEQDVETVRRAFEEATRQTLDQEVLNALFQPDHVLITEWGAEGETKVGVEGYRQVLEATNESWNEWRQEIHEVTDAGNGAVVVSGRFVARGRASGIPVEGAFGALIKMREGKLASTQFFVSPEEAFAAAERRDATPDE
jgi:ketosteroid isomerase-like protein